MKNLVLLGALVAAAAVPGVAAADPIAPCQLEAERTTQPERAEQTAAPTAPTAASPRATQGQRTAEQQATRDTRRRGGKGVPDAELIGPRGAL